MRWFYRQDGVLLVVKITEKCLLNARAMFCVGARCFGSKFNRTFARKQSSAVNFIADLVDLTAQYSPQIAL